MSNAIFDPRKVFLRRAVRLAVFNVLATCMAGYCVFYADISALQLPAGLLLALLQFPVGCMSFYLLDGWLHRLPEILEDAISCLALGLNASVWGFCVSSMISKFPWERASPKVLWNRKPVCLQCGYDLQGSRHTNVCPECGWQIPFDYQHWPEELEEIAERLNHVERDSTSSTSDT